MRCPWCGEELSLCIRVVSQAHIVAAPCCRKPLRLSRDKEGEWLAAWMVKRKTGKDDFGREMVVGKLEEVRDWQKQRI